MSPNCVDEDGMFDWDILHHSGLVSMRLVTNLTHLFSVSQLLLPGNFSP